MALEFDEINALQTTQSSETRSVPFEQYFGEMELTEEEREKRIKMAYQFNDMLLFVFALISAQITFNQVDYTIIRQRLESGYMDVLARQGMVSDAYIKQYAADFVDDFINTTFENKDDSYYLSQDRAMFISENESQTMNEYNEFVEAIKQGYKNKTWIAIDDNKTRKSHRKVDRTTIGIKELFNVGSVKMRFPKDYKLAGESNEAKRELINCRCHVKYSK